LAEGLSGFEIDEAETQAIASVDAFYVGSRYPLDSVDPSVFSEATAKSTVEKVDSIFLWFLTRINFGKE
jgi:HEPN domain-containing protein